MATGSGTGTAIGESSTLPISTAEAKTHLRVVHDEDDTYILTLINAATDWAEEFCRRKFMSQTAYLYLPAFPGADYIKVPFGELQSVTSISYEDADGATQTLSSALYDVITDQLLGKVRLEPNETWPITESGRENAVTVTFLCGYGDESAVPAPIKHALKLWISHLYEVREPVIIGTITAKMPLSIEALLWPYRILDAA